MNILFKESSRVSLVVTPTDLRGSFQKLCSIAQTMMNIDVMSGSETVVFISKSAKLCKIITADERGSVVIVRRLNKGTFERIMVKVEDSSAQPLSVYEQEQYLNGIRLYEKCSRYW
ncbi:IS66 family insertion sequence element accessory protein TnpB [uncultured Parasutterella sp.]|uniref:IS66 family insertion sequence element accessory protein TnpB n=1 Tax=uncultured Parasutterella sp. TaxID=1263098 RepID=UPI0025A5DC17|nr:IS66 family insertion sequence element accessory protein TnpB [uncultured Parasutterella sp.]